MATRRTAKVVPAVDAPWYTRVGNLIAVAIMMIMMGSSWCGTHAWTTMHTRVAAVQPFQEQGRRGESQRLLLLATTSSAANDQTNEAALLLEDKSPLADSVRDRVELEVDSVSDVVVVDDLATEQAAFLQKCKLLCIERNLPLQKVKNARDLASVRNSPVRPGRIFRMGRISDATQDDITLLMQDLNLQTVVDLRSPTELKDDPTLLRQEVFGNFTNMVWKERGRWKEGCLRELPAGQPPVKKQKQQRFWRRKPKVPTQQPSAAVAVDDAKSVASQLIDYVDDLIEDDEEEEDDVDDDDIDATVEIVDELCDLDCDEEEAAAATAAAAGAVAASKSASSPGSVPPARFIPPHKSIEYFGKRKERHFVSLMNEFKYVKGTVTRLRKRDITKALLKSPGALVSKRVRSSVKKPFLDEINGGGLPMLNELLLRFGAPGIKYVLELCADRRRHPIAFYCTAGKDRTGVLAAIILGLCGVSSGDIVEDYSLSANVYAQMNDHQAMVGALSQRDLNPQTFLGAPPEVMRDTLLALEQEYGSVEGYCNWIGFGPDKQEQLRNACLGVE